jgi:hypothetical protein
MRNTVDQAKADDGHRYLLIVYEGGQHIRHNADLNGWSGPGTGTVLYAVQSDGKGYERAIYSLHESLANTPAAFLRAHYRME